MIRVTVAGCLSFWWNRTVKKKNEGLEVGVLAGLRQQRKTKKGESTNRWYFDINKRNKEK
jgi:hypothetical protein